MISRLLIANRGEIARRVIATCRRLGISPVAVYSDADADAPHVAEADTAVRLPGSAAADTYLRVDALLAAAEAAAADAVHPGYGFLAEDAGLARAVLAAGLVWVGPSPSAIAAMGSKVDAKKLVGAAGVPTLDELDPERITEADLPVLVKASAGGGGRGMRVVRSLADLAEAVRTARAEAASAFGDDTVFCEPYLERGRHIEVQVLADTHGTVWTLGERECSIQRRHQKIVEETPSPAVGAELRGELERAAADALRAVDYVGAGTVEFLLGPDGRPAFLEANTRLQVEHPVTEAVTGLDLVAWQLRIAEGAALPAEPPARHGHAIEVRLYAEDPATGWSPQPGTVHQLAFDGVDGEFGPCRGLRLDAGVTAGSEVSTYYDPMLAKVIAWAPTRAEALRRLTAALERARLHGPVTNRDLLVRVLRHPEFQAGAADTAFLERGAGGDLAAPLAAPRTTQLAALAAALAAARARRGAAAVQAAVPSGWRNLPSAAQRARFAECDVTYRLDRDGALIEPAGVELLSATPERIELRADGLRHAFGVARHGAAVFVDSGLGAVRLTPLPRFPDPADAVPEGSLLAPMPGAVVAVHVEAGQDVPRGAPLLVLEAMKMQHTVAAPHDGVVGDIAVTAGMQVAAGDVLLAITP
jgi:propionyl-CoA carboxylase alpha chain